MFAKLRNQYELIKMDVLESMFKWVQDSDGDIGITIFGVFTLIKYKDTTIFYGPFTKERFHPAEKYQGRTG